MGGYWVTGRDSDLERRKKALAVMFGLCPFGGEASAAVAVYLTLGAKIPLLAYEAAIMSLMDEWTYPNPPQPGDIKREAKRILAEIGRIEQAETERRERLEFEASCITPGEAREILSELESNGPPTGLWEKNAYRLQVVMCKKIIARGHRAIESEAG